MAPILGYWNLRGLAEAIRFLLHHVEEDFEDKRYGFTGAPEYDRSEWMNEKYLLGLDFPNLPYFVDGNLKITQSLAILRYLGDKYNLAGKTKEERALVSMLEQQGSELLAGLMQIAYNPAFESLKPRYLQSLPAKLGLLSDFLKDREWFVGDTLTYVDFLLYEALDHNRMLAPEAFAQFPNLVSFLSRIKSLPNIEQYMNSGKFKVWPIYAPFTGFGGVGPIPELT